MRALEIITLSILAVTLAAITIPSSKRPSWLRFLPAFSAIVVLLQVSIEGYRWQMVPAYALSGIVFLAGLPTLIRKHQPVRKSRWVLRALAIVGSLLGLAIAWITVEFCVQVPLFKMPVPSGPYAVGTRTFLLVDRSRIDDASPIQNGYRTMSIQAWYPAELIGKEESTTYITKDIRVAMEELNGPPAWFNGYLDLIRTHAYWDASIAQTDEQFPVILYSPSGNASLHKTLFEELASQGYVVVSISHPHWSNVLFDDQGIALPQDGPGERYKAWFREESTTAVQRAKGQILGGDRIAILEQAQIDLNRARPIAIAELRQWSKDVGFVLDHLAEMNLPGGLFDGQIDLNRAGVMGFSLGGATAGQFCVTDARCRVGINIDGFMFGDVLDGSLKVPFMFIHSENPELKPGLAGALFYDRAEESAYVVQIAGARHGDLGAPSPNGQPIMIRMATGFSHFPDGAYLARIMNDYILAFLDKHLRQKPAQLLLGSSPYPEVLFMKKNAQGEAAATEPPLRISEPVETITADLESFIPDYLQRQNIPGAAIALIRDARVIWKAGFGVANVFTGQPVTPEHLFEVASNTKVVTAYIALRMVDQGMLSLDMPLNAYLSESWLPPSEYRDTITLRHVLSHRAGLGHGTISRHSLFAPARGYSYSAVGFQYVQAVIEELTGQTLEDVAHRMVFAPLGMSSSSLVNSEEFAARTANGHLHAMLPTVLFLISYTAVSIIFGAIGLVILRIWTGSWRPRRRTVISALAVSFVISLLTAFMLLGMAGLSEFAWMIVLCGFAVTAISAIAFIVGRAVMLRVCPKERRLLGGLSIIWSVFTITGIAYLAFSLPNLPVPKWTGVKAQGAGSMRATVGDMATFLIELSNPQFLGEKTATQLRASQVKLSSDLSWGLGPGIQHSRSGDVLWQWGQHIDFQSIMLICPEHDFGVVVCTNSDLLKPDVALEVAHRAVGGKIEPIRQAIHLQFNYREEEKLETIGTRFRYDGRPAFTIEFPEGTTRAALDAPEQVFAARTPEGVVFQAAVADVPPGRTMSRAAETYVDGIESIGVGSDLRITCNIQITLRDGTEAYRSEIQWLYIPSGVRLMTQMVSSYKDGKMVYVTAHPIENPERIIPIVESLRFD